MPPMDQAGGSSGLMQMLAQLQGGGGMPPQGPPMGDPQDAGEGEGGNPLIQLLLSMLMGGGQGMPQGGPPMTPQGGGC